MKTALEGAIMSADPFELQGLRWRGLGGHLHLCRGLALGKEEKEGRRGAMAGLK